MGQIFIAGKGVKLGEPDFQPAVLVINFSKRPVMPLGSWISIGID